MNSSEVTRSKDGVPQWNGDASTYQEYEEQALQWEQSIPYHKRYLAGPKLVAELSGPARKHVTGKRPQWLSFNGGVQHLLEHLRECLGRPTIPELTEFLNRYFRQSRRKKFETMNTYITRKTDRARQALARVQKFYGQRHQPRHHTWERRDSMTWSHNTWEDWQWHNPEPHSQDHAESDHPGDEEQWYEPMSEAPASNSWHHSRRESDDEPWKLHTEELLPEFLQGWYLLMDSGLESTERNMIQTALQDDFSLQRVSRELRLQWPDEELRRHDQNSRHAGFWADDGGDYEPDFIDYQEEAWEVDHLNGEGQALYSAAEERAQEAYALIQQGKRTLKEARARQHQVKLSRQYYKTTNTSRRSYGDRPMFSYHKPPSSSTSETCLRCGKGHRTNECPERQGSDGKPQSHVATEAAPFICFSDEAALTAEAGTAKTTQAAVNEGCAVIDGGATKTLGSVEAIQAVMDINAKKYGNHRIQGVDTNNTPTFGFGNSSQDRCISTTQLQVTANEQPGLLQIHALDRGSGPILLSIQTLRSLKAIIDFEADLLVLRGLDDTKIIPLERSAAGHQLLPLTEDLFKHAKTCNRQVPSLRDFLH